MVSDEYRQAGVSGQGPREWQACQGVFRAQSRRSRRARLGRAVLGIDTRNNRREDQPRRQTARFSDRVDVSRSVNGASKTRPTRAPLKVRNAREMSLDLARLPSLPRDDLRAQRTGQAGDGLWRQLELQAALPGIAVDAVVS